MSMVCLGRPARLRSRAIVALPLFLPCIAFAEASTALEAVIVTASRTPQPLSEVLADVSVLDRAAIEHSGATSVADVLARLPGVEFARNGGPGAATSVYLRGSESRHTAVFIDGVRVDSQSTGGASWESLPIDQIERIEVLRGPAAAIYGSDAVGGVVQLFTRRARGAIRPGAALSIGTAGAVLSRADVGGAHGPFDFALSASQARSDGFNARVAPTANPDIDGWRRGAMHARLGMNAGADHRLDASVLASDLRAQYDGSRLDDDVARHALRSGSLAWQGRWSDAWASRAQFGESHATYETRPAFYRTQTTLRNLVFQQEMTFGDQHLSATLERREDRLHNAARASAPALDGERAQDALALGWRGDFGHQALQAHVRHDRDSSFGGRSTGSMAWGWRFAQRWRATAAASTAFRAPTLYQRFSEFGRSTLAPETGRNVELGLRWSHGGSEAGAALWRNVVSQLLVFGAPGPCASTIGCYENVGRARYDGLTLSGRTRVAGVAWYGSLDWHDPRNLDTGLPLPRRARRLATFGVETAWRGWSFAFEMRAAGARFDNAANTQRLGGYAVADVVVTRTLRPGLALEARVTNLADKHYELARTYATPGRMALVGLRWAP